ncbi:MAG: lipoprotein-releasing system permease protein [Patiriisocius sp.]
MKFPFYIAKRYLFAKKSRNIINVITTISVVVIAFVTTAMIVILSAFNGIDELVQDLYSSLDADITIAPVRGKTIHTDSLDLAPILAMEAVDWIEPIIEENVILAYRDKQRIATIKGVRNEYLKNISFSDHILEGYEFPESDGLQYGLMGYGVKQELGAGLYAESFTPLTVYAPRRGKKIYKNREGATKKQTLMGGGVFSINIDFDTKYLITSLGFAKELFEMNNEVNHYEIKLHDGYIASDVKLNMEKAMDSRYKLITQKEKNSLIYKANESERLITIFILAFIVVIATFNIFASLTILIIDKGKDRKILSSLGATQGTIRQIFFLEGIMLSAMGTLIGLILGFILSWLQQNVGIIPLEGGIVDYYPVIIKPMDFILVSAIVLGIGLLFSWLPVWMLTKQEQRAG